MFELKSDVSKMVRKEILIYFENMIKYFKFSINHLGFQPNKTYKPFYIFNKNDHQIFNKIYIGK